jgi:hypothetical protein
LNPQAGQRHTACIRYISAPQRSQGILASAGGVTVTGEIARAGGRGGVGSDMAFRIIAFKRRIRLGRPDALHCGVSANDQDA